MAKAAAKSHGPAKIETRERILRATLDLIASDGLDNLTHRRVSTAAGVSLGTTTYHFSGRRELIREACCLYMDDYAVGLTKLLRHRPIDSEARLTQFLANVTALDDEAHPIAALEQEILRASDRDPVLSMHVTEWRHQLEHHLSRALEQLGFIDPLETARILIALCRGSEFEAMSGRSSLDAEGLKARLERALIGLRSLPR